MEELGLLIWSEIVRISQAPKQSDAEIPKWQKAEIVRIQFRQYWRHCQKGNRRLDVLCSIEWAGICAVLCRGNSAGISNCQAARTIEFCLEMLMPVGYVCMKLCESVRVMDGIPKLGREPEQKRNNDKSIGYAAALEETAIADRAEKFCEIPPSCILAWEEGKIPQDAPEDARPRNIRLHYYQNDNNGNIYL